jgi:metal-sulfur cluster biosynthetic enzyme
MLVADIKTAIQGVIDPELGYNILDLGLVTT